MTDLELLKDRIEDTTWYHIHNGKLVEGANAGFILAGLMEASRDR